MWKNNGTNLNKQLHESIFCAYFNIFQFHKNPVSVIVNKFFPQKLWLPNTWQNLGNMNFKVPATKSINYDKKKLNLESLEYS